MTLRLGLGLPQMKHFASGRDVTAVAREAEEFGFDSLWVFERTLVPEEPVDGMYGIDGRPWPETFRHVADPFVTLAQAAAVTGRVRLGTSVLVAPLHAPFELARMFATLSAASGGRVVAGLGTGWSRDEYAAAGSDFARRGELLDETIDVCETVWSPGTSAHEGARTRIAPSDVGPKPPGGRIPLLLAASNTRTLDRIARRADGWAPSLATPEVVARNRARLRELAEGHGRDPDSLTVVQRCGVQITDKPLGRDRRPHQGSVAQIVEDLAEGVAAGVDESIVDFQNSTRDAVELMDAARELYSAIRAAGM
ncbi:TIGR03619 family F420-dependent LLM class oxidoreductase [Streptomyces marispadix]|uniref:TIGR03619 family F420-dependent LLM class oxidoreductase n=1 Tax=Streptomyces marispadix TaxID=2922868 RepID=A0ABS9T604_9ACTN|nr:TIGR03619 family F420-dependent LLM class oxidoreductase [Streptomyces marispadix]MCH6163935.1 TIGR03619 family F420-dependent LLM class oxidoreductase [Streptomyces marispadix]